MLFADPPSRPGQPVIVDYDKDRVDIHWTASQSDGGNAIQKYVIEQRCLPDPSWLTVIIILRSDLLILAIRCSLAFIIHFNFLIYKLY